MAESGNVLSRNPNVCASCSSLADGLEGSISAVPEEMVDPGASSEARDAATNPEIASASRES